jgi:hypothetical protein
MISVLFTDCLSQPRCVLKIAALMPTIETPLWLFGFPSRQELSHNNLNLAIPV